MSRRKRNAISPTLFPFLAVLVCTLGTLILLLALVAQEAKTTAQQTAEREVVDPNQLTAAAATSMIEEEQFRADHLVSLRDAQTSDLERRRDELTHLDDQMIKLKQKLNALRDEVQEATKKNSNTLVDPNAIVMLRDELTAEEGKVKQLEESVATAQPRIIIVPHKGPNGTDRRAVYLECTRDGVKIWPEGVVISQVQLADTTRDANPLDAALRTIRYHARQHYGDEAAPYPLLVVRPDGTETYGMARAAMQDWDDQFGYELVPGEVDLAFPDPDPELKERIKVAIRQSAIRQHVRYAGLSRGPGGGGLGGPADGPARHRSGRVGTGFDGQGVEGRYGSSGNGLSRPSQRDDDLDSDRYGSEVAGTRRPRRRLPTLSASDLDRQGKARGYQSLDHGTAPERFDPRSELDRLVDNIPSRADESGFGDRDSINADSMDGKPMDPGEALSEPSGDFAKDPPSLAQDSSSPGDNRSQNDPPRRTSDSGSNAAPVQNTASGSSAAAPTRPSSMTMPPPSQSKPNDPSAQPPASLSMDMTPQQQQQPTVRREGRDWALPSSLTKMRGTEVVRPIHLRCYHDRYVLVDTKNPSASKAFRIEGGNVERATLEMATAVRDRVASWGASLPGGRWQPRLEVEVMPHGVQRFHQLRMFMTGSGVEVEASKTPTNTPTSLRSP